MRRSQLLIYGFTMFSMFFGSGNLVFPLQIGFESGQFWLYGFWGLFVTGIVLPFLGLLVIKKYKGSYDLFFAEAGLMAKHVLPLFTLSLLGSFGVIPRCITVAHGGVEYLFPSISLPLFGALFSIGSFFICLKERWMISILGRILTPLLLLFLFIMIVVSIHKAPSPSFTYDAFTSFKFGFFQGYETMDLFAAFFFSAIIFKQIQAHYGPHATDNDVFTTALKASCIGAGLLCLVYVALVFMGAAFRDTVHNVSPEMILPAICLHILGKNSGILLAGIMILACLTTAVALNSIYADYLTKLVGLPERYFPLMLSATTATSFIISMLDFKGISAFLGPVLQVTYPGLIILTLLALLTPKYSMLKRVLFYGITLLMISYKI